MLQCKTCGSTLSGTDHHDKCIVHRQCCRSSPCPLDESQDSLYWDEVEAIRAAAMGVRPADGKKKVKVTKVIKKGKKGGKGSLPRGVDPPVITKPAEQELSDKEASNKSGFPGANESGTICVQSTHSGDQYENPTTVVSIHKQKSGNVNVAGVIRSQTGLQGPVNSNVSVPHGDSIRILSVPQGDSTRYAINSNVSAPHGDSTRKTLSVPQGDSTRFAIEV